ncbi:hypothetical protein COCMIDRAFT_96574 [Bipolaris oryzae ATCC 44560]|uniref:Uncharacterized protein n=1 Tax=Bipolaris oryzae ATCC 44560 TaxID=930090 RepID=W6Z4Y0_COCMI|nr:uncharacterized protein COCMIDRAFT_96574 [Bipolaris oryzae ATCC 44560]EUC45035.1 hypothetical protein COCMIDRAFT_96574 [Bipolaris oryzae ATCC 44560]
MKDQSTAILPTSSPTETEAAAAPPPLKPSETAGVVVGSTAGVLLAIVAAIFLIRRYHALKHSSDDSGPYPEMAYLYDPFPDHSDRDSSPNETSTLIPRDTVILPSTSNKTNPLPRTPHNSLDNEYHHADTNPTRYTLPGNPFTSTDPFLSWRSSHILAPTPTPTPTSPSPSALATAVKSYSKGPQKPLPQPPHAHHTPLPNPHHTPTPSTRSSIKPQHSLRRLYWVDQASRPYTPLAQESTNKRQKRGRMATHDLPLPVDARSETPDSITLYAAAASSPSSSSAPLCYFLPGGFSGSAEAEESMVEEREDDIVVVVVAT